MPVIQNIVCSVTCSINNFPFSLNFYPIVSLLWILGASGSSTLSQKKISFQAIWTSLNSSQPRSMPEGGLTLYTSTLLRRRKTYSLNSACWNTWSNATSFCNSHHSNETTHHNSPEKEKRSARGKVGSWTWGKEGEREGGGTNRHRDGERL